MWTTSPILYKLKHHTDQQTEHITSTKGHFISAPWEDWWLLPAQNCFAACVFSNITKNMSYWLPCLPPPHCYTSDNVLCVSACSASGRLLDCPQTWESPRTFWTQQVTSPAHLPIDPFFWGIPESGAMIHEVNVCSASVDVTKLQFFTPSLLVPYQLLSQTNHTGNR